MDRFNQKVMIIVIRNEFKRTWCHKIRILFYFIRILCAANTLFLCNAITKFNELIAWIAAKLNISLAFIAKINLPDIRAIGICGCCSTCCHYFFIICCFFIVGIRHRDRQLNGKLMIFEKRGRCCARSRKLCLDLVELIFGDILRIDIPCDAIVQRISCIISSTFIDGPGSCSCFLAERRTVFFLEARNACIICITNRIHEIFELLRDFCGILCAEICAVRIQNDRLIGLINC